MTRQLIDIAKEQGGFVVDDELEEWNKTPVGSIIFDNEAQLQATINAVNAQNSEAVNSSFQFWTEKERREISNEGQFGLFCSEDEACDIIQEVEALCFRKWKLSISPQVIPPQTLPPEWAEYVGRLERALENYSEKAISIKRYLESKPTQEKGVFAVVTELSLDGGSKAQEAISSKPKDR